MEKNSHRFHSLLGIFFIYLKQNQSQRYQSSVQPYFCLKDIPAPTLFSRFPNIFIRIPGIQTLSQDPFNRVLFN